MKSFLTSYSQPSLLSPLRSRMENRCCHEPTYLLKTGKQLVGTSFPFFTLCCLAPTTSATTANFSSKDFYPTQNVFVGCAYASAKQFAQQTKEKPLHLDSHAKREGRPFYPKFFFLSENRNNPKNITAKNEFSVLGVRKRLPLGAKQDVLLRTNSLPYAPDRAKGHQDGKQTSKELVRSNTSCFAPKAKRVTLGTHLSDASKCSEKIPASKPLRAGGSQVLPGTKSVGTKPLRKNCLGTEKSLLPEKFINLLMANGEKDKARRCLTQALFSITTHCQKHNLQNNSPLEIFTDSFFKQESTESKESTADNSLQRATLGTVQQKTRTNELVPLLPKGKSNSLLVHTQVQSTKRTQVQSNLRTGVQSNKGSKRDANPGKPSNVLRDVALVLLESRLDNLSNGRYSGTKKSQLYPSVKEGQGLLSQAKGTSIFRLNHIERVEKRLLSKQNGFFFLFVKQKGKLVGVGSQDPSHRHVEKQTGKFKIPLSLPFCGKSFETTFSVFLPLASHAKQNNPFLSLIRLSLKEKFLISEKGFASLALHKKVQQSYLCSAFLHLVRTKGNEKSYQTLPTSKLCIVQSNKGKAIRAAIKGTKYRTYTTTLPSFAAQIALHTRTQIALHLRTHNQQIHFLPFLPYSALFNWREKSKNPLFGFAKQSQRFLLELCKAIPNRSVKGTEKVRQNNLFGSFPLLSAFYSACTPSSPFSPVPTPSITSQPVDTGRAALRAAPSAKVAKSGKVAKPENNPFYRFAYCAHPTSKLLLGSRTIAKPKRSSSYKDEYVQQGTKFETKGLDKFVGTAKQHKQVPQKDSHSNTKDKKTPLCFTQGIPPLAKKVFSQEKDAKSVHTGVLLKGIQRVQPTLEVRRVRKGRNTFQVPSVVKQKRGEKVGIKWIIDSARRSKRKGNKLFSDSLANQLVQSFDRLGEARSKRNELLKLAESNRPFLRFRWW